MRGDLSLVLCLFLLATHLGCNRGGQAHAVEPQATENPSPAERIVAVRTLTIAAREATDTASLPADLAPLRRALLAAEVGGTVDTLHVDEGSEVATGRVLAEIDTRALRQRVAEAEAVATNRQIRFERAAKLLERHSITQQQFLDATTDNDVAHAQLEAARLALDKSRIKAPWKGTVAVRRVEVGDYVVPGQPVFELLDVSRLKVRAPAPSSDVPFLRRGLPAEVRVDAYPGEVFQGQVVRLSAELDAAARALDVEVEIDNPTRRLRPGMFARLAIPRRTLPDAVLVPLAAIVELEQTRAVYVVEDGRAVQRPVILGPVIGDEAVIAEGLTPGEQVIVEGQLRVSPGQKVNSEE